MNFDEAYKLKQHITTLMTMQEQEYLFNFAQKYGGKTIVEIGAYHGGSTALLCLARPEAEVISFDLITYPDGIPASNIRSNLSALGITNHTLINQDTTKAEWVKPIDLLFIDGDHSYKAVMHDLQTFAVHTQYLLMHDVQKPDVSRAVHDYFQYKPEWHGIKHPPHLRAWRRDA